MKTNNNVDDRYLSMAQQLKEGKILIVPGLTTNATRLTELTHGYQLCIEPTDDVDSDNCRVWLSQPHQQ